MALVYTFLRKLLPIILLVGCTSLQERGEEYLAEGSYDAAMATFSKILSRRPQDLDAKVGLRKARLGWTSANLIQVRRMRLANNSEESLDLLLAIYENQNRWQVFPRGNTAFTQQEETEHAQQSILNLVQTSLKDRKPLRGQFYLDRFALFFQNNKAAKQLKTMKSKVRRLAAQDCRALIRDLQKDQYFYGLFIERYCQHWNLPPPDLALLQKRFNKETYSRVALDSSQANGFPRTFALDLENKLHDQLKDSPWHDPSSPRVLNLKFMGEYNYSHETEPTILTHSYTVSIPYEVTRVEKKEDSNSSRKEHGLVTALKITGLILSAMAGDFESERQTDNGDGTVTVYETRYRDEVRTQNYAATSHLERFDAKMALQGRVNQWPLQVIRNEDGEHNSLSHQNSMTGIGLYPKSPQLIGSEDWIQNERQYLANQFGRDLKQHWQDRFCHLKRFNGQNPKQREQAFRCLQVEGSPTPIGFRRWFKNQYGLELNKAINLLYRKAEDFS